jgi:ectoine hydroxylase-related dioxygenase (phytanoyl-CoA dioxygenase family)
VTTPEKLRATLEQYGVAIIHGVIDSKECQHMLNGMWDYLEHASQKWKKPIQRTDKSTWGEMRNLWPIHTMLIKQFGIGQTQMNWDLRQNPKVADIFAQLWNVKTQDLLTSFDGASFHMPPETVGRGFQNVKNSWWHTDQSLRRNDFECVQSWITALETGEGDATLAVLEGSHKLHAAFAQEFQKDQKDKKWPSDNWHKLTQDQLAWYQARCQARYITCPAGAMVFWDSRSIHYARQHMKGRAAADRLRCIAYMCMAPRKLATPAILKKRIAAFENGRTTSHWPHRFFKLNPTQPRTYGKSVLEIPDLPLPQLTSLGRRLVGYDT